MSRCMSCNRVLSSTDLKYKQKETGFHDGMCGSCRTLCFDYSPIHEYTCGSDSIQRRISRNETIETTGLNSGSDLDEYQWYNELIDNEEKDNE